MTEKDTDLPKDASGQGELPTKQIFPTAASSAPGPPGAQEGPPHVTESKTEQACDT